MTACGQGATSEVSTMYNDVMPRLKSVTSLDYGA